MVIDVPADEADKGSVTLDKIAHKLLPDHDYKVRVSATNDQSEGPASGVIRFTTGTGGLSFFILLIFQTVFLVYLLLRSDFFCRNEVFISFNDGRNSIFSF